MYIDDCVQGSQMLLNSDFVEPINIGSSELVSINQLVDLVEDIAGVKLKRNYNLNAPKGVNGRNSDNTLIQKVFGWEPSTKLRGRKISQLRNFARTLSFYHSRGSEVIPICDAILPPSTQSYPIPLRRRRLPKGYPPHRR